MIEQARQRATDVVGHSDLTLSGYLPQLGWPMFSVAPRQRTRYRESRAFVTALANVLHAFAIEFERDWPVGLAAGANVLRVVDERGVPEREIPLRAGVSKEAAKWATGVLEHGHVKIEPDPHAKRGKVVRLTAEGSKFQKAYEQRAAVIEQVCAAQCRDAVADLREALEQIAAVEGGAALRAGTQVPAGCWRTP